MTHLLIISLSRSGGKLLRMLLDGHTRLNTFPFEHWQSRTKSKFPRRSIEQFAQLSVDDKLAAAGAEHVERKLRRLHPESLVADVMKGWREDGARTATLAASYERLAFRYFTAISRDPRNPAVNHCGSLCRLTGEQINAMFGEGTHLMTVRDPRAVFVSMESLRHRKFTIRKVQDGKVPSAALERHIEKLETVGGVSGYLREFCEDYRRMLTLHADREGVIRLRFEDLVTEPEASMRRLCDQLAIEWQPVLLTPTQLGAPRPANSSYGRRGDVIHPQAAGDWIDRISKVDCTYIEDTLTDHMHALGYLPRRDRRLIATGMSLDPQ